MLHIKYYLREKCPYSELFWCLFSRIWTEYGKINTEYSFVWVKKVWWKSFYYAIEKQHEEKF